MSRKKAARAKKNNIKKQVENAAEVTETAKAQETAGQAATGEIPSPDVQTEAETAESETEVKEAAETVEEAEPKEAEKIEEKAEPEEAEKIEEKAEPEEAEKIEEKAEPKESEKIEEKAEPEAAEKAAPAEEKKAASELTEEEKNRQEEEYKRRFQRHFDELKWLYTEVYGNDSMFAELCDNLHRFYEERNLELKESDRKREENPNWYKQNDMLGMMLYIDNFAGNIKGVEARLDYLEKSNVNYIHLMPFLETPKGRSDGGYAVSDFRKVQENLGTMEDLESLTAACRKKNMNVCMDFVMNHTSEDHEWAKRARQGDGEYMSRYFFYDNDAIPQQYERTVPQVFPTTAPGNFTWLDDIKHYVMTTFYPYQWDLNYKNPRVFNEMMYNFLFFANKGIDVIRIDAVPYIWKELNTDCRNLPRVHTIVRMMRMIGEIVCPGILLLGEVVMEPEKVVPYFGTVEKPECHMLYNVTTMATTWHTVATRDVWLLKRQLDIVNNLPKEYVFLNYLRCHDDIGWGLDYPTLEKEGIHERTHKQYLNDYFRGYTGNSTSRGVLYNEDLVLGDARFCGTTASMCGIEKAGFEEDAQAMERAIQMDVMLHAYMFMQSGIPVLYSGDEMGQVNDYTYKEDPDKIEDSRYIHRGAMRWDLAKNITDSETVEGKLFGRLNQLEEIRKSEKVFVTNANVWTVETWEQGVLCIGRYFEGEKLFGLFNFSEYDKIAWINEIDGSYVDLISGEEIQPAGVHIPPYGFYYLKRQA
ncbi:amylosucrase [Schaedlerella arabinosiphila]|uniref:amylosucrase n=1 Tax=Schaedlerella arabinosiphila TaxID=2044587 RepID=UPI0025580B97|nr:amylosucrase [Schaedlerella arabinosiphila]